MGEQKEGAKSEVARSRDNYMSWSDDCTKYMLEWYIDLRKDKPATFKFKKQPLAMCPCSKWKVFAWCHSNPSGSTLSSMQGEVGLGALCHGQ